MVIELVLFKTIAGTPRASLASAIVTSGGFLQNQPGFIRRSVGIDETDTIADLVFWESQADADASMALFPEAEETKPFMSLIDPATVQVRHFASLAEMLES